VDWPNPWLSIVLLGVAIFGYAWMMPKPGGRDQKTAFESEAAYDRLLEDLETENRELIDAVAKFKHEQDETVAQLGRRLVDMEHQMKQLLDNPPPVPAAPASVDSQLQQPPETVELPRASAPPSGADIPLAASEQTGSLVAAAAEDHIVPPTTIRGRYPELLGMYAKGRSVEQIAKTLGMNKGEVQLILQLAKREEAHDA